MNDVKTKDLRDSVEEFFNVYEKYDKHGVKSHIPKTIKALKKISSTCEKLIKSIEKRAENDNFERFK